MSGQTGRVYLVGAGCQRADMITVRGLSLLKSCDVVIYDDLIPGGLLSAAPSAAEKVYMGKRCGRPSAAQDEICTAMIAWARKGKQVVRLKGGDPFVFGRGGEECLALQAAGVPYEVVPGVTSAIALPAAAGIPVTHRGLSRSVHIITAHTAGQSDGLAGQLEHAALLPGTLVFLMGLSRLPTIAQHLLDAGRPPDTPAAVISGAEGTRPAVVRAPLGEIAETARQAHIRPPAVIVVGEVAAMDVSSPVRLPLSGVTVGVTGTDAMREKLRALFRGQGAQVFDAERTVLRSLPLDAGLGGLPDGRVRWLVFTSGNGVRLFFRELARLQIDLRRLHACRIAVIGPSTGQALRSCGLQPDLCPSEYTTAGLAQALCRAVRPEEPIFLLRSAQGSPQLAQTLAARYDVHDMPLYELEPDPQAAEEARPYVDTADCLIFSSASGVRLFLRTHGAIPPRAVCVCIGKATADELRPHCQSHQVHIAQDISADGLLQTVQLLHRQGAFDRPSMPDGPYDQI